MNTNKAIQSSWRFLSGGLARIGIRKKSIEKYLVIPVANVLAALPGRAGLFFDQVADQFQRDDRIAAALAEFEADLARLDAGSICIDLGANVGTYTEKLAARAGTVHAFEPDHAAFAALTDRVGQLPNVVLHNAAVATRDGVVSLRRHQNADTDRSKTTGSSIMEATKSTDGSPVDVECVDFLRFVRQLGRPVALVKMDIEGSEIGILEALLTAPERDLVEAVYVETHAWMYPEQLVPLASLRRAYAKVDRPRVNFYWP
jgi:FkbM family methyltransferase